MGVRERAREITETVEADSTEASSHMPKNTWAAFQENCIVCRRELIELVHKIINTPFL